MRHFTLPTPYCSSAKSLRERAETQGAVTGSVVAVSDCAAYRYTCGELLFLVALDDWNVDTAFVWLERITSAPWQQSPYGQHPWRRMGLTEPAGKLASRLSVAGLREQAGRSPWLTTRPWFRWSR